jgi:Alpha amylase, catalytic domain
VVPGVRVVGLLCEAGLVRVAEVGPGRAAALEPVQHHPHAARARWCLLLRNFALAGGILEAVNTGDALPFTSTLLEVASVYPQGVADAPFLASHDQVRVATMVGGQSGKLANAAALLLTLPGSPFLYDGEVVGLQNGTTVNDEAKRTPMPWNAAAG